MSMHTLRLRFMHQVADLQDLPPCIPSDTRVDVPTTLACRMLDDVCTADDAPFNHLIICEGADAS